MPYGLRWILLSERAVLSVPTQIHTPLGEAQLAPQLGRDNGCSAPRPARAHGRDKTRSLAATCVQDSASTPGRRVAMIRKISWPTVDNQLVTTGWVGPVPTEFLNSFFKGKAKFVSIFAKQFNWKRKKHQFYTLFIQTCPSLKSTYHLRASRWLTSVLRRLESEQIAEPNLPQSTGERQLLKRELSSYQGSLRSSHPWRFVGTNYTNNCQNREAGVNQEERRAPCGLLRFYTAMKRPFRKTLCISLRATSERKKKPTNHFLLIYYQSEPAAVTLSNCFCCYPEITFMGQV